MYERQDLSRQLIHSHVAHNGIKWRTHSRPIFTLFRNILLSSIDKIKIGDFGLMRNLKSDQDCYVMTEHQKVPMPWCAPESLTSRVSERATANATAVTYLISLHSDINEAFIALFP